MMPWNVDQRTILPVDLVLAINPVRMAQDRAGGFDRHLDRAGRAAAIGPSGLDAKRAAPPAGAPKSAASSAPRDDIENSGRGGPSKQRAATNEEPRAAAPAGRIQPRSERDPADRAAASDAATGASGAGLAATSDPEGTARSEEESARAMASDAVALVGSSLPAQGNSDEAIPLGLSKSEEEQTAVDPAQEPTGASRSADVQSADAGLPTELTDDDAGVAIEGDASVERGEGNADAAIPQQVEAGRRNAAENPGSPETGSPTLIGETADGRFAPGSDAVSTDPSEGLPARTQDQVDPPQDRAPSPTVESPAEPTPFAPTGAADLGAQPAAAQAASVEPRAQGAKDAGPIVAARSSATEQGASAEGPAGSSARSASASRAPESPDVAAADRVRLVQRVARAFEAAGARGGTIRIRLHPPELGALRLEVHVRNGAMTARLEVESNEARTVLLENLPALRDRLAAQDIKVARFDVEVSDGSPQGLPERSGDQGAFRERGGDRSAPSHGPDEVESLGPRATEARLLDESRFDVTI